MRSIILIVLVAIMLITVACFPKIKRLNHVVHLFDEDRIVENFRSFNQVWPVSEMTASKNPAIYPKGQAISLPKNFHFMGKDLDTESYLKDGNTTGLLVIQDNELVFEEYYLGNTETTRNISWSVAKSFISALVGIAVEEGHIKSISQTVEEYVPELKGSAYEGVTIKDVLQMSTGVGFNEDYGDFFSDINRWGRGFALGSSQDKFAASLKRELEPGTLNHYVSINTHVLGMILTKATNQTVTAYMQEKLWNPAGMEHDAYWVIDNKGMEAVLGGLNATLRDFGKLGSLFLNNGYWNGQQVVPADWVEAATKADAPHLLASSGGIGYGYQWWLPYSTEGEYLAQGVYSQFIYVNPTTKTVIVKLSANASFTDPYSLTASTEANMELFRAIAHQK